MYEKTFSLIFVVRVESYNNFGSSNLEWPIVCTTERSKFFIDLVGNFQKVEPANEYDPGFISPEIIFCRSAPLKEAAKGPKGVFGKRWNITKNDI